MGLCSIWLSGFLLICFSFCATQFLPFVKVEITKPRIFYPTSLVDYKGTPNITIFCAPSPFNGSVVRRQDLAVRSWLELSPNINIVLFGNHPSLHSFASSFGSRVRVESEIDFS